jgi:spore coat polysaccharide biosynthesis protein SpsF
MKIVASIEARMGSTRLPGKMLEMINGHTVLGLLIHRLRQAKKIDDIIVATTINPLDDELEEWCKVNNVACYRGDEDDVLRRVVESHKQVESDLIVEITGDCPLTDPEIIDLGIDTYLSHDADVVTNCGNILTWPMGIYVQVFSYELLSHVEKTINDPVVREHVSLYFYEHTDVYNIINIIAPVRWESPNYRFQLDYPEDLKFIRKICDLLEPDYGINFGIEEIMSLIKKNPYLIDININCIEKEARI